MDEVDYEEAYRLVEAQAELRDKIQQQKLELQSKKARLAKLRESEELRLGLRLTAPLRRVRSSFGRGDDRA